MRRNIFEDLNYFNSSNSEVNSEIETFSSLGVRVTQHDLLDIGQVLDLYKITNYSLIEVIGNKFQDI